MKFKLKIITPIVLGIKKGETVSFKKDENGLFIAYVNGLEIGIAKEIYPKINKSDIPEEFEGIVKSIFFKTISVITDI